MRKLSEYATFNSGVLTTRIRDAIQTVPSDLPLYNPFKEERTYFQGNEEAVTLIQPDQVVISVLQQEAFLPKTIKNKQWVLTSNFVAVSLSDDIDIHFFTWWFNHSDEARRQLASMGQIGRRIVLGDIRRLMISLPDRPTQQKIGSLYDISQQQGTLLREKAQLIENRTLQFIQQNLIEPHERELL